MLFRRSTATTRAHQEEAIRRRKSGRNSLRADRHRRRTGQAGREDLAKSCLSGCSAQECRARSSLRGSRAAALPSGCDAVRHILLGIIWRTAGGRLAASLHRVAPPPAHGVLCVTPERRDGRWDWPDTMAEPESTALITQSTMTAVLRLPTASISTRSVSSKTSIGIATTEFVLRYSQKVRTVWPIPLKKSKSSTTNFITPTSPKSRMSATPKSGIQSETAPPKICL